MQARWVRRSFWLTCDKNKNLRHINPSFYQSLKKSEAQMWAGKKIVINQISTN